MCRSKHTRLLFILVCGVLIILAGTFIYKMKHPAVGPSRDFALHQPVTIDGTVLDKPRLIRSFILTAGDHQFFTERHLKHHWTLLFFGFTNCGYVCPTSLAALNKMYIILQTQLPPSLVPQVVMVSVDPERDTADKMKQYMNVFNKNFIGTRADMKMIKALADQLNVVFAKIVANNGAYSVNHTAEIMLIDPNGKLRAFFAYPHRGTVMARDYENILSSIYAKKLT